MMNATNIVSNRKNVKPAISVFLLHCTEREFTMVAPPYTQPIRTLPLGSNALSRKYLVQVPVETALGTIVNETGWTNIIDLNTSKYMPRAVFHGVEFFRTHSPELAWRLLDHRFMDPASNVMWYIIPRGTEVVGGTFRFFRNTDSSDEEILRVRASIGRLVDEDFDVVGPGSMPLDVYGAVSVDGFIRRVIDRDPWLIYNGLQVIMPGFMRAHGIQRASITNRRARMMRK